MKRFARFALGRAEQIESAKTKKVSLPATDIRRQNRTRMTQLGNDALEQAGGDDAVSEICEYDCRRPFGGGENFGGKQSFELRIARRGCSFIHFE